MPREGPLGSDGRRSLLPIGLEKGGHLPSGSGMPLAAAQNEFPLSESELCFQVRASVEVHSPCFHEPPTKTPPPTASGEQGMREDAFVHEIPSTDVTAVFPPPTRNCFPVHRMDPCPLSDSSSEVIQVVPLVELSIDPSARTATKRPAPNESPRTPVLPASKEATCSPSARSTRQHPASF